MSKVLMEIKEKIENKIKNMTEKEIAIYSLTNYQKHLISLCATEKYRLELTEKEIEMNLKMFREMTKNDILNYLVTKYLLEELVV